MPNTFTTITNIPADVIRGVDISHHNANVDWQAIKDANVSFVYIKVSDGIGTPDEMAPTHALNAKQNGLKIGYYHFCRPQTRGGTVQQAGIAEAQDTLKVIANLPVPADLPLMLDLENVTEPGHEWDSPLNRADYLQWIHSYIDTVAPGGQVFIYTYKAYMDGKLPADHDLGTYPLWLASYHTDANNAACPVGWADWQIWQFEGKGVLGKNNPIDLDVMKNNGGIAAPAPAPHQLLQLF